MLVTICKVFWTIVCAVTAGFTVYTWSQLDEENPSRVMTAAKIYFVAVICVAALAAFGLWQMR